MRRSGITGLKSLAIAAPIAAVMPPGACVSTSTWSLLRRFNPDYRVVFVGDATMSPYEIEQPGGSVEHWNDESGRVWMQRIASHFHRLVWLNPEPVDRWQWTPSIGITRELVGGRMFPLTLSGLDQAMRELRRRTRVVGCFPDGESALMLVAARLRHVAGTKWGARRYLDMGHLQDWHGEWVDLEKGTVGPKR